jgi:uncharacterized membrane protein
VSHSINKTHSLIRLEAFADAVIAVAITLMVVDLRPPTITLAVKQNTFDFSFLHQYWPKLFALTLSFLVITETWIHLLSYFRGVTRASVALIWLTMAHLFAICLIPWGAAFLAENPTLPQAVSTYGFLVTLGLATVAAFERQIESEFPDPHHWGFRTIRVVAGVWAISIPLAFVSVYLSYVIIVAITLLALFPQTLRRLIFDSVLGGHVVKARGDDA